MKLKPLMGLLLTGALSSNAFAGTFDLTLSAETGSRWYEYYSDVYAELGSDWGIIDNPASEDDGLPADGFFAIGSGIKVGGGSIVFPSGGLFLNVGSLSFDDVTGQVNGLSLDFDNFIADNDSVTSIGYTTSVGSVSGSVATFGGDVSSIDLLADITFTYDSSFGVFDYAGVFSIEGDTFTLSVDDTNSVFGQEFRYVWDASGGVENLSPVPETSTYAMLLAGLGVLGAIARRRRKA